MLVTLRARGSRAGMGQRRNEIRKTRKEKYPRRDLRTRSASTAGQSSSPGHGGSTVTTGDAVDAGRTHRCERRAKCVALTAAKGARSAYARRDRRTSASAASAGRRARYGRKGDEPVAIGQFISQRRVVRLQSRQNALHTSVGANGSSVSMAQTDLAISGICTGARRGNFCLSVPIRALRGRAVRRAYFARPAMTMIRDRASAANSHDRR